MSTEAALLREIERLSGEARLRVRLGDIQCPLGAINRHKNRTQAIATPPAQGFNATRGHRPREVVINGAAYESSKRKLTRKDCEHDDPCHLRFDSARAVPTAAAPRTTPVP